MDRWYERMRIPAGRLHPFLFAHAEARTRLEALLWLAGRRAESLHVVGGAVRDALSGRDVTDFDFAVRPDALEIVEPWASACGGSSVALYEHLPTRRVVFPDGMTADFVQRRATELVGDLALRDFTVNAIAVDLSELVRSPDVELIDPLGGLTDLRARRLVWASDSSLEDDPLRILRAFRLMASHGLRISANAWDRITLARTLVERVSRERVRDELFRLLGTRRAYTALRAMDDAGVLDVVFPELAAMRGVPQNEYHHLDVWEHTLAAVDVFEREPIPDALSAVIGAAGDYLTSTVGQFLSGSAAVKLALLFHDAGKPSTRTEDETGRVRFIGHEAVGAALFKVAASRLRMSRRVRGGVEALVLHHLRTMHLAASESVSPRALLRFTRDLGPHWVGLLMLSWADLSASRGPARSGDHFARTSTLMSQIAAQYVTDERAPSTQGPLVTGDDVMGVCGIGPGPDVGSILHRVERGRLDGELTTRSEALSYIRGLSETG